MITAGEVLFVKEVLMELASIADPNEYYEGEVQEALHLLDKLMDYDTEQVMQIADQINQQLKEIKNEHD
jgi:hypothetical protein